MGKNKSGYSILYKDFEHKGYNDPYDYDIPFDIFMDGIRAYFDNQMVTLDGKDTDVWNVLADLGVIDDIYDVMEDWFIEKCRDYAYEEYQDWVEWYYDDELKDEE